MMRKTSVPFAFYERATQQQSYAQFINPGFAAGNAFIIAAADAGRLLRRLNARVDALPGFAKSDALIITRRGGHRELWVDPRLGCFRDAHLAFFDAIAVDVPAAVAATYDSDHAYPRCAAGDGVGLTLMNFIPSASNRSFGGGWERRLSHRTLETSGLAVGTLVDMFKCLGGRLRDPKDLPGSIMMIPDLLIGAGQAPAGDRQRLRAAAEQALAHWQWQDEAYAMRTDQHPAVR